MGSDACVAGEKTVWRIADGCWLRTSAVCRDEGAILRFGSSNSDSCHTSYAIGSVLRTRYVTRFTNDGLLRLADLFSILLLFPHPVHDEVDGGGHEAI